MKISETTAEVETTTPATRDDGREADCFSISDLAREFEITPRAIRFYESRGLISPERVGTQRRYSRRDRARLILILRGRNLGFTVEDVGEYLALYDADPNQTQQTKHLLEKINAAIADLEVKRVNIARALDDLSALKARCETHLTSGGKSR